MNARTTDRTIAKLIGLGTEQLASLDRIPPLVAQVCARRWLIERARDAERQRTIEIERSAENYEFDCDEGVLIPQSEAQRRREAIHERLLARVNAIRDEAPINQYLENLKRKKPYSDYDIREAASGTLDYGTSAKFLLSEWDDDPVQKYRELRAEADAEHQMVLNKAASNAREMARYWNEAIDKTIEERASQIGMEWTAALLTSTVALPDGTRVLWGEATVEQHESRLQMLKKHAATELETATRHQVAIDAIRATPGAVCLNDVANFTEAAA